MYHDLPATRSWLRYWLSHLVYGTVHLELLIDKCELQLGRNGYQVKDQVAMAMSVNNNHVTMIHNYQFLWQLSPSSFLSTLTRTDAQPFTMSPLSVCNLTWSVPLKTNTCPHT